MRKSKIHLEDKITRVSLGYSEADFHEACAFAQGNYQGSVQQLPDPLPPALLLHVCPLCASPYRQGQGPSPEAQS